MLTILRTDSSNSDFLILCRELDIFLNRVAGGEENRAEYVPLNRAENLDHVFVIYWEKNLAGCGAFKEYDSGVAEIKRVFVREEYRGRGLGKRLISAMEEEAKKLGYRTFILETGEPLVAAMKLYKESGYRIIPNYGPYTNMAESVCMRKILL